MNWINIKVVNDVFAAEVLKSKLENNNIAVQLVNKKDSSYPSIGFVELWVPANDELSAYDILNAAIEE